MHKAISMKRGCSSRHTVCKFCYEQTRKEAGAVVLDTPRVMDRAASHGDFAVSHGQRCSVRPVEVGFVAAFGDEVHFIQLRAIIGRVVVPDYRKRLPVDAHACDVGEVEFYNRDYCLEPYTN